MPLLSRGAGRPRKRVSVVPQLGHGHPACLEVPPGSAPKTRNGARTWPVDGLVPIGHLLRFTHPLPGSAEKVLVS